MRLATIQNIRLATLFALIAAFFYALMGLFVKLIGTSLPTTMVLFARFIIALILLLPWFLRDKRLFLVSKPATFIFRSGMSLLSLGCMFYAIKYIALANALLLNNTNALFVPVVAWLMLGTRTPIILWLITLLGFLGVVLVLHPDFGILEWASLVGLCSGLFGGMALVQVRQLTKTSTTQQILFYYFFISSLVTGLGLLVAWQTPTWYLTGLLLAVGVCGTVFQYLIVLAFTYAPVRLMSILMFLAVLIGVFFDWWVWDRLPDKFTFMGMLLIVLASIASVLIGKKALLQMVAKEK